MTFLDLRDCHSTTSRALGGTARATYNTVQSAIQRHCREGNSRANASPYNRAMGAPPPISIQCECGEARSVPFGQTWTCERCGRSWDTQQIPANEYLARVRRMRRFQIEPFGLVALGIVVFAPFIFFVDPRVLFLALVASFAFITFYMPYWRRRVRRAAADAPKWELHPE
jgi:hypothetical protein